MPIFYYFLKRNLTGRTKKTPYPSFDYLGEPGEYVNLNGVGYTIVDYAVEFEEV